MSEQTPDTSGQNFTKGLENIYIEKHITDPWPPSLKKERKYDIDQSVIDIDTFLEDKTVFDAGEIFYTNEQDLYIERIQSWVNPTFHKFDIIKFNQIMRFKIMDYGVLPVNNQGFPFYEHPINYRNASILHDFRLYPPNPNIELSFKCCGVSFPFEDADMWVLEAIPYTNVSIVVTFIKPPYIDFNIVLKSIIVRNEKYRELLAESIIMTKKNVIVAGMVIPIKNLPDDFLMELKLAQKEDVNKKNFYWGSQQFRNNEFEEIK